MQDKMEEEMVSKSETLEQMLRGSIRRQINSHVHNAIRRRILEFDPNSLREQIDILDLGYR